MVDQLDAERRQWLLDLCCNADIGRMPTERLLELIDMGAITVKADGYELTPFGLALRAGANGEAGESAETAAAGGLPGRSCFDIDASMHEGETRRHAGVAPEDDPGRWEIL